MSKRNRERRTGEAGGGVETQEGGRRLNWLPIVLAVVALVLGFVAWADAKKLRTDTTKRLVDIDTKMAQMQTMMANIAKSKPPAPQQGPDPAKVYTVKTDGSPTHGNPTAPIVIAEFSDYQ